MRDLTSAVSCTTLLPSIIASPAVGRVTHESIFIVVVFPAPLTPKSANNSPSLISSDSPSTAVTSLYFLVNPTVFIAFSVLISPLYLLQETSDTQHLLFIISQPICFVNGNSPKRLSLKAQAKSRRRKFRRLKIFYEEKCLSAFFCGPGLFYFPCFILRIGCCIGPHRTRRAP